jgi:phage shock protein PspC (stress-responsive transcriptional regulator)
MTIAQDLERLSSLYDQGKITAEEFRRAKEAVLGQAQATSGPHTASAGVDSWLKSLHRSRRDAWLGGVCGGLAASTDTPSWLWRLVFALLLLCAGTGVVLYLLLWVFLPAEAVLVTGASYKI